MGCKLQVTKLRVRSLSVDFNEVSWEVEPTTEDVLDYTFQVLRSEAAMGPFDELGEPFEDRYLFIDNAIKSLSRYRQLHYTVRVRRKSSGEYWDFGPETNSQEADLVTSELRSHISLLMREFIGERCWVIPVRTFGTRCPSCWSATLKKRTRSGCRTCYDTSFIRGYMHPIESWVSFDPNPAVEQFSEVSKLQVNDTTARMTYFPPLKPGDLIIMPTDKVRYKVTQVSSTKHVGTPVHQEIQIHEIPQSAIEYLVPLKLCDELKNIFLKPERNFTNPQQLEALGEEATNGIFSLYQTNNCGDPPCR